MIIDDDLLLDDDTVSHLGLRVTEQLSRELDEVAVQIAAGRPRLRKGRSAAARLALAVGLRVIRESGIDAARRKAA